MLIRLEERTGSMGQDLRNTSLDDDDFHGWTTQQADLLRHGCMNKADLANSVEEVEALGRSETRDLESAYRLIALHLLKMIHQPDLASRSWLRTIVRERKTAQSVLADNPSLRSKLPDLWISAYHQARKEAAAKTDLPPAMFPQESPLLARAQDETFMPPTILDADSGQTIGHTGLTNPEDA